MNLYTQNNNKISVSELTKFSMLGAIMFCSKVLMEWAPNIHFLGMFTIAFTVVYRKKALVPIYIYVFLNGLYGGFSVWWIPYLYIWTILWGIVMLLPKRLSKKICIVIYPCICALHGFAFGILYSPAQAIMFGFDFKQTISWIVAGIPYDIIHGIGNLVAGIIIVPMISLLNMLERQDFR